MNNFSLKNGFLIIFLTILLLIDLNYIINRDWIIFFNSNDDAVTIASITGFSWLNNLFFVTVNLILFFLLFFFIHKNEVLKKIKSRFELDKLILNISLIVIIAIFTVLTLPYSNPLEIGNFGDIFHDSEKLAFIPYIYNSYELILVLEKVFTLHGWFQDLFLSYLAYTIYGAEKIIFGIRSVISLTHLIVTIVFIFLIYYYNKFFLRSDRFTFTLLLTLFATLEYINVISVIDRQFFLYLILIIYLNFDFINIDNKKNVLMSIICGLLICLSFFYNFYQFVTLSILNLITISLVSYIFQRKKFLLIYFSSLFVSFLLFIIFFDFTIILIGFQKISELVLWGSSKPIYDMRFGYRLSNGVFQLTIYLIALAYIFFKIFIDIAAMLPSEKFWQTLKLYIKDNILLIIFLILSLSGFYEFLVRGHCCYVQRASAIHFLILGYLIFRFINLKQIKLLSLILPLILTIIIFSSLEFKKKVYHNANLIFSHFNSINKTDSLIMNDNLGLFKVINKISDEVSLQDCFYSFQDDAFLQVKLNKTPCTSNPITQDLRSKKQLNKVIKELEMTKPNLILFDIDNYNEFYSVGLRVEDNVRSTIYSNLVLEYLLDSYSPFVSYNGFHIWKRNVLDKNIIELKIESIEKLIEGTPFNICKKYNIEKKCFIGVYNSNLKLYIDVLDGKIDSAPISQLISLSQKHYFIRNFPKNDNLSLIPKKLDKIEIILISEKHNFILNEK